MIISVIVVDNDPLVRDFLCDAMLTLGERVLAFPTAELALPALDRLGANGVLVTDIDLGGGMDGLAFATVARRRIPLLGVLYISGRPSRLPRPLPDSRSVSLAKPFSLLSLRSSIDTLRDMR